MYNDAVKVANKIISYNDLLDIFNKINEDLNNYLKISKSETLKNEPLQYGYQKWSFKDNGSNLKFTINFYDNTEIKFDNYNNFISIFNTRLEEIKTIYVYYYLAYSSTNLEGKLDYHHQSIAMYIYERKIELNISLESNDNKMNDVYEMIKNKIQTAPERYDNIIRNKSSIYWKVGTAIAFIPSIIFCTLLLFIPSLRIIMGKSYVLFPICTEMLTFLLSSMFASMKLDDLYKNIIPKKRYVSYEKGYKDDIDKYLQDSEILIGKNVHNMDDRKEITRIYDKYKKYIPYEIIALVIMSIIVIVIGLLSNATPY